MKVARLYAPDDIRIEDVPIPRIGPGDALLKTRASGICSGDAMGWYIRKKAPLVLGHEPAGVIVELGKDVKHFAEGQRVFVHHHAPCYGCRFCGRGDYVQCETWRKSRLEPGGVSEYILVPAANLSGDTLVLPESVDYEDGALIEPLACSLKAMGRARVRPGDTVLVMGLGFMGMLNIILAHKEGARRVIGADKVPYRLKLAREFGASEVIDVSGAPPLHETLGELTSGEMADAVLVGPGSIPAMKEALRCAAPGGTVVLFTPSEPGRELSFEPNGIYFKDITVTASYSAGPPDTAMALKLIERGLVSARRLVTHRFTIQETQKAYDLTREARDSLKCMITFK